MINNTRIVFFCALLCVVTLLSLSSVYSQGCTNLLQFDDINCLANGGSTLPNPYQGFNYPVNCVNTTGYGKLYYNNTGLAQSISPHNAAYKGASTFSITKNNGSLFDFVDGCYGDVYMKDNTAITITGYTGTLAVPVFYKRVNFTVTCSSYGYVRTNWKNVVRVTITIARIASTLTSDRYCGSTTSSSFLTMDNICLGGEPSGDVLCPIIRNVQGDAEPVAEATSGVISGPVQFTSSQITSNEITTSPITSGLDITTNSIPDVTTNAFQLIGPCSFTPAATESFESFGNIVPATNINIFSGFANLQDPNGYTFGNGVWGLGGPTAVVYDGVRMFGHNAGGGSTIIRFNSPIQSFGGYFAYNAGSPPLVFTFYDNNNILLGTNTLVYSATANNGNSVYSGYCAGTPIISRVDITGYFHVMDLLSITPAPSFTSNGSTSSRITSSSITTNRLTTNRLTTSQLTSNQITSASVTSSDITSQELTTQELTTQELTTQELTTQELTTQELTTQELTTQELTTQELTTQELTTQELTTQELTTQELTTQELTTQELTTQELTTQELTTQELTTQELTTQELTTQELTTQELTTQELTTQELTTQELTTQELTTQELTTQELTTQELTTQELTTQGLTTQALTTQPLTTQGLTTQSLTTQGLTTRSLTTRAVTSMGLTTKGLTTKSLTTNPLTSGRLTTGATVSQICSGYSFSGPQGYFCTGNGSGYYQCLKGAFSSQSARFNCPAGTSCKCSQGTECSNGGTQSPCTSPQ